MIGLAAVRERMERAAEKARRDPATVLLIAVTKMRTVEEIRPLYDAGVRDFGENYLQEALPKIAEMPPDCRWHYIGSAQTKKMRALAEAFSVIHSVAKPDHARAIRDAAIELLIQVNVAEDEKKSGIESESLDATVLTALDLPQANLRGLMTIGVDSGDPEDSRPVFRRLRLLAEARDLSELSMGMSGDLEVAVQEGATMVRIGTALFGPRPPR